MKIIVALFLALAIASCKASAIDDTKYQFDQIENAVRNNYQNLIKDIKLVEKLGSYFRNVVDNKKLEFVNIAESAKSKLDNDKTVSEKCKEEIKKQIEGHKTSSVKNFFTCSNLTDAMVETGSIIVLSLELTANITQNFDAIFGRLDGCSKDSLLEKPICWFKAVLDVKGDIETDMNDIGFFKTRVFKLAHDIAANVEFCAHPPKQNLNNAIKQAMDSAKDCQKVKFTPKH